MMMYIDGYESEPREEMTVQQMEQAMLRISEDLNLSSDDKIYLMQRYKIGRSKKLDKEFSMTAEHISALKKAKALMTDVALRLNREALRICEEEMTKKREGKRAAFSIEAVLRFKDYCSVGNDFDNAQNKLWSNVLSKSTLPSECDRTIWRATFFVCQTRLELNSFEYLFEETMEKFILVKQDLLQVSNYGATISYIYN